MTKREYNAMYTIIGAAMEVHKVLGKGMLEAIYQEVLFEELSDQGIVIELEKQLSTYYKNKVLKKKYYADMYYNGIIIELKSTEQLCNEHRLQLFNYMRISQTQLGLLINFGEKSLRAERYMLLENNDMKLITKDNIKDYIED